MILIKICSLCARTLEKPVITNTGSKVICPKCGSESEKNTIKMMYFEKNLSNWK